MDRVCQCCAQLVIACLSGGFIDSLFVLAHLVALTTLCLSRRLKLKV